MIRSCVAFVSLVGKSQRPREFATVMLLGLDDATAAFVMLDVSVRLNSLCSLLRSRCGSACLGAFAFRPSDIIVGGGDDGDERVSKRDALRRAAGRLARLARRAQRDDCTAQR